MIDALLKNQQMSKVNDSFCAKELEPFEKHQNKRRKTIDSVWICLVDLVCCERAGRAGAISIRF